MTTKLERRRENYPDSGKIPRRNQRRWDGPGSRRSTRRRSHDGRFGNWRTLQAAWRKRHHSSKDS